MGRTASYLLALCTGGIISLGVYGILLPRRRRRLMAKGLGSPVGREAVLAFFWMYCGGMAVLTLLPRWVVPSIADFLNHGIWNASGAPFFALGAVSLMPFRSFYDSYIILGNVVMFLPFGFFPAVLFQRFSWWRALLTGFCLTLWVETTQLFVGRAFDIDDVWLNTLGTFLGFLIQRTVGLKLQCEKSDPDKSTL